jgi:peroxiredoxin Q/BCP
MYLEVTKEAMLTGRCNSTENQISCHHTATKYTLLTILACISFLVAGPHPTLLAQVAPHTGDEAPGFLLPYATQDSLVRSGVSLSQFRGKRAVILAFYPADWSTGCTTEACSLRDNFAALESLNAEILAISGDYLWSHHAWAKALHLPFKLLSDHNHAVAKLYGSYNDKSMYNRRTVFLIDREGRIKYSDLEYSVADQRDFEKLKSALQSLR